MSTLGTAPRPFLKTTQAYRILTKVQNVSALAFSTFTAIHGTQILAANLGGASLANHLILLGRPFYQDEHLEGVLVTGAATVHVLAGLGKWGIRTYWDPSRVETHRLRYAGYALIPLVGLHYYLVRMLPIAYYGDSSFIDFGYVAWGLQNKPALTYGLHTALILTSCYHLVGGLKTIFRTKQKKVTRVPMHGHNIDQTPHSISSIITTTLSLALISGMIIIARDTTKIPLRLDFANMYFY
ncbi:uncharacterized protein B0P05DRAFT_515894 [Gilbertella persicaria]|uniref:Mitochondrial adapter protein MCP1 transmembrane domain-containing protein n=1 Tax=Rhizopus stolonifer TaxID=4846 RepID=A0A367KWA8_RHIST|nr:uncharacterized protein B0P05DRAFT_515894 [Gilbertella persicaria]KAI8063399.1 hypothetical protein B0P05DRAFT_515894 [Gilbertella persicaria]RCI06476.1 hypothetical protein CU098_013531 [Rhizopus stolonifer]